MAATAPAPIEVVDGLRHLAPRYDLALCDVWGVLHDGVTAFPAAGEALSRFRAGGGRVVLISNAPRPGAAVMRLLDRLGVVRSAYDAVVTSGDLTRQIVRDRVGEIVHHVGPARDRPIFEGSMSASGRSRRRTTSSARACSTTISTPSTITRRPCAACASAPCR
jgi:ribonucleotide monophosphatase NagD (HAD superfamily)